MEKGLRVNYAYFQAFAVVQFPKYKNYVAPFRNEIGAISGMDKHDFKVVLGKMSQYQQKEGSE